MFMLLLFHLSGCAARMQEATMTKTPLEDFLIECVAPDPDGGLPADQRDVIDSLWDSYEPPLYRMRSRH
ncbi:hypothetical protein [Arthrobacter sp. NicSoilB8]|uniref:hypothetical protein n=1 Tax=Arthrobacter sp. NicSoilB8 TaxID=2830998 RepID=UPI001CC54F85|nr:hypothetical protein [Arthrobacter sp. NicSoilB8]BCW73669.1 hypothetical protein NicSoilB8_47130 [Arthrobacter sp. NicSoilB8]